MTTFINVESLLNRLVDVYTADDIFNVEIEFSDDAEMHIYNLHFDINTFMDVYGKEEITSVTYKAPKHAHQSGTLIISTVNGTILSLSSLPKFSHVMFLIISELDVDADVKVRKNVMRNIRDSCEMVDGETIFTCFERDFKFQLRTSYYSDDSDNLIVSSKQVEMTLYDPLVSAYRTYVHPLL